MKQKVVTPAMLMFSGILFLVLGIFCMTSPSLSERIVFYIAEAVLIVFGTAQVLAFLFNRNKRLFTTLLSGAVCFVVCILFL